MKPLKLGFALEGNSDYLVIPILVKRLVTEMYPQITLAPHATRRPRERGHGFIKRLPVLAKQMQGEGVHILVAVVDTDDQFLSERRRLLQEAQEECRRGPIALCLATGLAVQALEAWLMDPEALFAVFNGRRSNLPSWPSPERLKNPKAHLNQAVRALTERRELGFSFFASELAQNVRLDFLRRNCSAFRGFVESLSACIREWQRL
jgi:hypothetical protein